MLDWIASGLAITGVILNAKKIIWCWPIWNISNVLWIIYWYPKKEWAVMLLVCVYFCLNLYGLFSWEKNGSR